MKIVVCVKIINGEINPFDACALECALSIDNADISVISMGALSAEQELLRLSRLDVSKVILLTDTRLAGSDTLATGYALSVAIKKLEPDMVICGRQSIDGDTAQVGPCLSEMLGFNLITNIMEIKEVSDKVSCETRMGAESVSLPAVLTVERINNLRFPRMRSAVKGVEKWSLDDIDADADMCGLANSPTKVLKTFESKLGQRKCRFITMDELDSAIKEALAKSDVSEEEYVCEAKLESVTVIGEELRETAEKISKAVKVIESENPDEIAELIKDDKVVLWKADLWGRRTAPIVAAKLKTGLCADCTRLETDGEKLFMYRPAFGGSLTAKIECRTNPQMATVRCASAEGQSEIVFGFGKGAAEDIEKYKKLAEKYGAETGASRGAVDMGLAPYEAQIGLTGKNISPKVYVACGISGAVQHTCGYERAGTVIAINPDKDARIFDFADYGIIKL